MRGENLRKGFIGEVKAMADISNRGYTVSVPIAVEQYDFLVDKGGTIKRVQVKYLTPIDIRPNLVVLTAHSEKGRIRIDWDCVDIVAAYLSTLDTCAWFRQKDFVSVGKLKEKGQIVKSLGIHLKDKWRDSYYKNYTNPKWL